MIKTNTRVKRAPPYAAVEYDHPAEIALYFGFLPIRTPLVGKEDVATARGFGEIDEDGRAPVECKEKSALLAMYLRENMSVLPHPLFLEYRRPMGGLPKRAGYSEIGLDILGYQGAAAEAAAIRTACSILEDEGFDNLEISLNSLGDRDSIADFERNLLIFVRKNIASMPSDLHKAVKKNVFELIRSDETKWQKWRTEAPKCMSFLSETARIHFKEVLEYIEALGFPYHINPFLIGNPRFMSHTIFEIFTDSNSGPVVLGSGFRYGRIGKRLGIKRDLPALSLSLSWKSTRPAKKKLSRGIPRARFSLLQIGYLAKLKALNIIESLRRARISVVHSIVRDKLTSQMTLAETGGSTHVIIIGQKEALEDSVVVRDNATRVQETVPIADLAAYLKKLK